MGFEEGAIVEIMLLIKERNVINFAQQLKMKGLLYANLECRGLLLNRQ